MFRNMKTVSIILALFLLGPLIGAEYGGDGHSIQTYALVHEPKQVDRSLDSREERSLRIKEGYYDRTKKKNTPAAGNRKKENINTKQLREKTPDTPKAKSIAKDITDSTNSVKKVYTWEEVKKIIDDSRNVGGLKRHYSNRFCYRRWTKEIEARYGSMTKYMTEERLHWGLGEISHREDYAHPLEANFEPLITWNDWPYGSLEEDVKHLIVWVKWHLESDPGTGRLTEHSRDIVQGFVEHTFIKRMKWSGISNTQDRLRWFKNGFDLQSVPEIEHFHVLLKGMPSELLRGWTGEDEPEHVSERALLGESRTCSPTPKSRQRSKPPVKRKSKPTA